MDNLAVRAGAQLFKSAKRASFVLALIGLGGAAIAQSFAFNAVNIEGNRRVADGTILTFAGISAGEALSAAELNDAAQRIRESGLFETVEITPVGRTLLINVSEYPTINRINIEGNARIKDDQLLTLVRSEPRRVYNPAQAEQDTTAITQAYAQQGRVNAVVTPRIIRLPDNRVDLVFEVVEAGVTEIERISFVGNRTYSERRLRLVLDTKQAGPLRSLITRDTYSPERIARDRELLTDFYRSRGYPDFVVQNVDVGLTRERDAYLVTFNVREGQKFSFGNVSIRSEMPGVNAAEFEEALRIRTGATYSPVPIETDISRIERLAQRRGINFMQVDPVITRNDRALQLNVEYVLRPGPRVFVERIDIEGNGTTLDRVIRNQFRVVEGDPFNPREIRESARRIRGLGFFQNASVDAREGSSPSQVIIDVNVVEGPTGSLSFGANFNTDTGAGLLASYRQSNFQGRGQRLNFQVSTAEANRRLSFGFDEPQFLGRDLNFGFDLSYKTTDNENALYDTETFRISPSLGFPVSENGRLAVFAAYEFTDLTDVADRASEIIRQEAAQGTVTTGSLGYSYSYDTRRTGLNPNAGVLLRFGQEFGFGDAEFIKTTALAGAETKILNEEVTLRATVEGGSLSYQESSSRVTDRFFLGSRVMRGFEAGGIGPRDAETDDALGGNTFAVARLEAEFPLGIPSEYGISGGAFIDYGSVWNVGETFGQDVLYDEATPRTVAGLAILWDTPIGPLRFNFTEDLDSQERDRPKNFDVTIQTSF
ncbi:outer membrane protein assembly factor BamA [Yoonia sediminilitoris]|uniref:Outer membrane protein assembly factor BamA n=1 Tax=Yoonia sediminilitoris TaxID=1286148 RepID=A0A2T6KS29_9RHOB|nr:outer membrane protein assembly factor BamA [Yoonia sediminilitoris]PUB19363.1 Beta-barrel assembly machine subunit BamA [Yoonia sediminilitoris]RCW99531.1 Beta-barrel assembly machine subunit BamA [Yoonia sediminilitoris]